MSAIFVHGLGQASSSWKETINRLDIDAEVNCPDLFELCKEELNYDNLYRAFSDYCNSRSEPLNLCGLSLGGMLALNYAIHHPYKVHSLILIGTQYAVPKKLMVLQNIIFQLMPKKIFENIGISKKKMISLTTSMMNLNFENDLGKITCPTLILCGEKDKANIRASKQLKKLLCVSELKFVQDAGHEINMEKPELLSQLINDFWDEKEEHLPSDEIKENTAEYF